MQNVKYLSHDKMKHSKQMRMSGLGYGFLSRFSFFLVSVIVISFYFNFSDLRHYLSHNLLFLYFFGFT